VRPGGLYEALAEVAESSLFAFCDPGSREAFVAWIDARGPAEADGPGSWRSARIGFSGVFKGTVEMRLPAALARDLCASFAGSEPGEQPDAAVDDFVGELANMVCGLWLTRTSREHLFDLQAPVVTSLSGTAVAAAARRGDSGEASFATVNDTPVSLRLDVERG
jgi:hypothetical protein